MTLTTGVGVGVLEGGSICPAVLEDGVALRVVELTARLMYGLTPLLLDAATLASTGEGEPRGWAAYVSS